MARRRSGKQPGDAGATPNGGATTGYEAELWAMADALRGSMDAAEYKHDVLGRAYEYFLCSATSNDDHYRSRHCRTARLRGTANGHEPDVLWRTQHWRLSGLICLLARQKDRRGAPESDTRYRFLDTITRQTFILVDFVRPPMGIRDAFESIVTPIMERLLNDLYEIRALSALRDTLLPKLVSGEVRMENL